MITREQLKLISEVDESTFFALADAGEFELMDSIFDCVYDYCIENKIRPTDNQMRFMELVEKSITTNT